MTKQKQDAPLPEARSMPVATQGPTPADLLQVAIDKDLDMEKLEQLMSLQMTWEREQAAKAYTADMASAKLDAPKLAKSKHVQFGAGAGKVDYYHESLADCTEVVIPWLAKHGFSHDWSVEQHEGGRISVTCVLTHRMGHSKSVTMDASPDTSGSKNPIQAIASATRYLQRYTLQLATGLAAHDGDDDGRGAGKPVSGNVEKITQDQSAELYDLIKDNNRDMGRFLKYYSIENLHDLPASRLAEAKRLILQTRGQS